MDYRVAIGFDPRQALSYQVCQFSLIHHASQPLQITPLVLETLPTDRAGLTPFTFSRFLAPWLNNFRGWVLFMDSDIIAQDDVCKLWDYADPKAAVCVAEGVEPFERAAVILFNCAHEDNLQLTPIKIANMQNLHTIGWTKEIAYFPERWNHCVGYAKPNDDPGLVHYTQGIPAFKECRDCEHADRWIDEYRASQALVPWPELMGTSIHAHQADDGSLQPKYKATG